MAEMELREAVIKLSEPQPYLCEYKCIARTQGGEEGEFAAWMGGRVDWMIGDSVTSPTNGRDKKQDFVRSASSHEPFDLKIALTATHSSGETLVDSSRVVSVSAFPDEGMTLADLQGKRTATEFTWNATETVFWAARSHHDDRSLDAQLPPSGLISAITPTGWPSPDRDGWPSTLEAGTPGNPPSGSPPPLRRRCRDPWVPPGTGKTGESG